MPERDVIRGAGGTMPERDMMQRWTGPSRKGT